VLCKRFFCFASYAWCVVAEQRYIEECCAKRSHKNRLTLCAFWLALLVGVFSPEISTAANYPCSGKKGGVSHCAGDTFVCNDGSVSGSKRSCSAEHGGGARQLMPQPQRAGATASECSCRSGNVCTGPRGGRYCMTDAGNKSYLNR
jgi:hypothetical protein